MLGGSNQLKDPSNKTFAWSIRTLIVLGALSLIILPYVILGIGQPPPPEPTEGLETIADESYYAGSLTPGQASITQVISLEDSDNDDQGVTITEVEIASKGSATDADMDRVEVLDGDGNVKGTASVNAFPVTISITGFSIPDDRSDKLKVRVKIATSATVGHKVDLESTIVHDEGSLTDATGSATDGSPERIAGDTKAVFRVERDSGNVYADGAYYGQGFKTGGADIAEHIKVSQPVEPGDVIALDPKNLGYYRKSQKPYSTLAAGVVSTEPGVTLGELEDGSVEDKPLIALMGTVSVKATTENGPIHPGDLLTTSSTPGHAMACQDTKKCGGAIIGKALEPLNKGKGTIKMLVMR